MKNENGKAFSFISFFKALCWLYRPSYIYLFINFMYVWMYVFLNLFLNSPFIIQQPLVFVYFIDWNSCQLICQLADLLKLSWNEKSIPFFLPYCDVYQIESAFQMIWLDWIIGLLSFNHFMWVKAEVFHKNIAIFHKIWVCFDITLTLTFCTILCMTLTL